MSMLLQLCPVQPCEYGTSNKNINKETFGFVVFVFIWPLWNFRCRRIWLNIGGQRSWEPHTEEGKISSSCQIYIFFLTKDWGGGQFTQDDEDCFQIKEKQRQWDPQPDCVSEKHAERSRVWIRPGLILSQQHGFIVGAQFLLISGAERAADARVIHPGAVATSKHKHTRAVWWR